MTISQLLKKISPRCIQGPVDVEVTGLFYDSRRVQPGGAFFALRGQEVDGHRFIDDALARGAGCIFLEEERSLPAGVAGVVVQDCRRAMAQAAVAYFGDPTAFMPVVGVTGTNGKTTVTYLVESILHAAGRKPAVLGTINYRCGSRSMPAPHTTPESVDLLGTLDVFRREGADALVAEVSSHALDQQRVAGVQFDVGVFTNLTPEHLDFHGSMENYFASKEALFSFRKEGQNIRAVVNVDDPYGARLAARLSEALTCSTEGEALIRPRRFTLSLEGVEATVDTPRGPLELRSPLLGKFNLQNLLCAVGAGIALDLPLETVARGLAAAPAVPGRLERIENDRGALILVDYAHTGDALEKVLSTLIDLSPRRILALFGCGGDRDRSKRPVMGEVGSRLSDLAILTSDNPRTEDPLAILEEVRVGALRVHSREWSREEAAASQGKGFIVIPDRREAIRFAVSTLTSGDLLLVAGKGHEDYQIVGRQRFHFDDREELRRELTRLEVSS
jgi:UDP-N-acetylmuramoyl-L-alanyl-D-glutamate--2,6-diaminopimelate ligase